MTSGQGQGERSAGLRRLALLALASLLVLLFLGFAIAQGIGQPSIPSGDIVLVEDAGDAGNVSQADFDHTLVLAAAQAGEGKAPKPGDAKYEEIRDAATKILLEGAWFEGQAAEMGIEVSNARVAKELGKIKKESFPGKGDFEKFLKESKFTDEDVNQRVRLQILSTEIQEQFREEQPDPSQSEIENYYEAAKATMFTEQPSRDVRVIVNKDKAKAEEAKALLEKDSSPKSWEKVATKFSEDPNTKDTGGLQAGLTPELLQNQPELSAAVFDNSQGDLIGPVEIRGDFSEDVKGNFFILEVESSTPEEVQDLKEVEAQIENQLAQRNEKEAFDTFVADFTSKWTSRTICADGYVIDQCSNFKGDGRPEGALPACYEEDPDGGRPVACPAPVFQLVPTMPGTVTPLEPKGEQRAQRPVVLSEESPSTPEELPAP